MAAVRLGWSIVASLGHVTMAIRRAISLALGVVVVLGPAVACAPGVALIPEDVHEIVSDDGRMRTYDLAWQEIRQLNVDIQTGDFPVVADDALTVIARMQRLETGSFSRLRDRATWRAIETIHEEIHTRDAPRNIHALADAGLALQNSFDEGDFLAAKEFGLRVYVLARHLEDSD